MEQTNDERRRLWVNEAPPEGVKVVVTPSRWPSVVMVVEDYQRDEYRQKPLQWNYALVYWEVFPEEWEALKDMAEAEQAAWANERVSTPVLSHRITKATGADFPVRTPKQQEEWGEAEDDEYIRG